MAWAIDVLFYLFVKLADIFSGSLSDVFFDLTPMRSFILQVRTGQVIFLQVIAGFIVAIWAQLPKTQIGYRVLTLFLLISLLPPALTGHAGSQSLHQIAVISWGVHILAISLWSAGVAALVYAGIFLPEKLYSYGMKFRRWALFCFIATVISGITNAYVRISFYTALVGSEYGRLLIAKSAITVLVALFGVFYRRRIFIRYTHQYLFVRLLSMELFLMALAVMLGVLLSGTAFPRPN